VDRFVTLHFVRAERGVEWLAAGGSRTKLDDRTK